MRALAFLVGHTALAFPVAQTFYGAVARNTGLTRQAENTALEQLFLSLHQLSALEYLRAAPSKADVGRVGIVAWYYGIYYAARAMLVAQTGAAAENHSGTANEWDQLFGQTSLVMAPFALRVTSLVSAATDAELAVLRRGLRHDLQQPPVTADEAHGACCGYLSGSADWYRWRTCTALRRDREFRALGVADFRTRAARELRDRRLAGKTVGFVHQAYRYRGKANYREALFLAYGSTTETLLTAFVDDLRTVLHAFLGMAGAHVERRLGTTVWTEFVDDVEANRAFSLSPRTVWA
jgi:hypothetical protein